MGDASNLALYVATYADESAAKDDFEALRSNTEDDWAVVGAVVMSRGADGKVDVLESGVANESTAGGALIGGGIGLVIGLFAPPLLLSTAVGAGLGALVGEMVKRHDEKQLGVELDEYFPPNSSAVVVVVDNEYLDRVESALGKADKKVSKAIDEGDYDKLKKALDEGSASVQDAIDS